MGDNCTLNMDLGRKPYLYISDLGLPYLNVAVITTICYEMDKTGISMFEILEPGGSALGKYSI